MVAIGSLVYLLVALIVVGILFAILRAVMPLPAWAMQVLWLVVLLIVVVWVADTFLYSGRPLLR